jgi:addiction module RelE/StbE family toxin
MQLNKTDYYIKIEQKFFRKQKNLIDKYAKILKQLEENPFHNSLKTHKLKGKLNKYYACSLTYSYRIILTIEIIEDKIVLIDIGTHDEVY